jgi:hypothetical protein
MKVEKRVLPVTTDEARRVEVFKRDVWRIAVEHLDYGEQRAWSQLAGWKVQPANWRKARAMLDFDKQGDLKREFRLSALTRNNSGQVKIRAVQDIANSGDAESFDDAVDHAITWGREERREAARMLLTAIADQRVGSREQVSAWTRRLAEATRELHEEYAVQRWPETKRLLGLLVNSSGQAHAKNANRIANITRDMDRRLAASILAASTAHSPEAERTLREAWNVQARKPSSLARELLKNFPKRGGKGRGRRRGSRQQDPARRKPQVEGGANSTTEEKLPTATQEGQVEGAEAKTPESADAEPKPKPRNRTRRRSKPVKKPDADSAAGDGAKVDLASVKKDSRSVKSGDDKPSSSVDSSADSAGDAS